MPGYSEVLGKFQIAKQHRIFIFYSDTAEYYASLSLMYQQFPFDIGDY